MSGRRTTIPGNFRRRSRDRSIPEADFIAPTSGQVTKYCKSEQAKVPQGRRGKQATAFGAPCAPVSCRKTYQPSAVGKFDSKVSLGYTTMSVSKTSRFFSKGWPGRVNSLAGCKKSFSSGGRCFSADVNYVLSTGFSPSRKPFPRFVSFSAAC
jgi:hypothetical protein